MNECGGDKAAFVKLVTKRHKRSRKGTFRVKAGFYTPAQMKDTLNYTPQRIAAIVKYCSAQHRKHDHREKDKYEKGLWKYWVEENMLAEFEGGTPVKLPTLTRRAEEPRSPQGHRKHGGLLQPVARGPTINVTRRTRTRPCPPWRSCSKSRCLRSRCHKAVALIWALEGIRKHKTLLLKLHDELAEIKTDIDSQRAQPSEETMKKLSGKFIEVEKSVGRAAVEANKVKKTVLKGVKPSGKMPKSKAKAKASLHQVFLPNLLV
ncbi:unnamed protein product [Durusdinium trenchii]|uniref:Uncharacterized protein n=1 Tax=Durusdinium trenchii TaxID=1381693 RepID=A0ABP0KT76_9DINO